MWFSTLNLKSIYWQVELAERDTTPFMVGSLWECN